MRILTCTAITLLLALTSTSPVPAAASASAQGIEPTLPCNGQDFFFASGPGVACAYGATSLDAWRAASLAASKGLNASLPECSPCDSPYMSKCPENMSTLWMGWSITTEYDPLTGLWKGTASWLSATNRKRCNPCD